MKSGESRATARALTAAGAIRPAAATRPRPAHDLSRAHRVIVKTVLAAVMLMSLGMGFLSTTTGTSYAIGPDIPCSITGDFYPTAAEAGPGGAEGFLYGTRYRSPQPGYSLTEAANGAPAVTAGGGGHTQYELTGVRGATWGYTSWYAEDGLGEGPVTYERSCSIMDAVVNTGAGLALDGSRFLASMTIGIRQSATDSSPFLDMMRSLSTNVTDMRNQIFIPGLGLMVMLTGIWVMTKFAKMDRREVISGVAWTILAATAVLWLTQPTGATTTAAPGRTAITSADSNFFWIAASANDLSTQVSNGLSDALLPTTGSAACAPIGGALSEARGTRMLDCSIWQNLVFDPWARGQFGAAGSKVLTWSQPTLTNTLLKQASTDKPFNGFPGLGKKTDGNADDVRLMLLRAQAIAWGDQGLKCGSTLCDQMTWSAPTIEKAELNFDASTRQGVTNWVRAYMWQKQPASYTAYAGGNAMDRLGIAGAGLLAGAMVAFFVIATSIMLLMWHAVVVVILLALPIVGLVSIYPPLQKHLRGLFQLALKAIILTLVFTVMQLLCMVLVGIVLGWEGLLGWKVLMLFVLILGLWKVIQSAREDAFTPNLGGQGSVASQMDPDAVRQGVADKAKGAYYGARTVGMAMGGVAGGAGLAGMAARSRARSAGGRAPAGGRPDGKPMGVRDAARTTGGGAAGVVAGVRAGWGRGAGTKPTPDGKGSPADTRSPSRRTLGGVRGAAGGAWRGAGAGARSGADGAWRPSTWSGAGSDPTQWKGKVGEQARRDKTAQEKKEAAEHKATGRPRQSRGAVDPARRTSSPTGGRPLAPAARRKGPRGQG